VWREYGVWVEVSRLGWNWASLQIVAEPHLFDAQQFQTACAGRSLGWDVAKHGGCYGQQSIGSRRPSEGFHLDLVADHPA
jgi:hypothetical protein